MAPPDFNTVSFVTLNVPVDVARSKSAAALVPPPADEPIEARIVRTLSSLTPAHRQMAEFVRANLFRAATMRIDEFADANGVWIATANRFAHALGFDGYAQFRANLVRGFEATLAPVGRLRTALDSPVTSAEVLACALELDIQNIDACASPSMCMRIAGCRPIRMPRCCQSSRRCATRSRSARPNRYARRPA